MRTALAMGLPLVALEHAGAMLCAGCGGGPGGAGPVASAPGTDPRTALALTDSSADSPYLGSHHYHNCPSFKQPKERWRTSL